MNIQLPDKTWTYVVLEHGKVREQVFARTKKECWERMRDALRQAGSEAPPQPDED